MPVVYDELRRIARRHLRSERPGHTLSTTGLVHEAYLRLVKQRQLPAMEEGQFFAAVSQAMRRVLVDYARRHRAARRGGPNRRVVPLDALSDGDASAAAAPDQRADLFVALDEALDKLAALNARTARVVECRFFGGMSEQETARLLGVSVRTIAREWMAGRAWLFEELRVHSA